MKRIIIAAILALGAVASAGPAAAAAFYNSNNAALAGATVEGFDTTYGYTQAASFPGLLVTSTSVFKVDASYSGAFGATGNAIDNQLESPMTFTFAADVSAFGITIGAINSRTTAFVYDANRSLLGTIDFGAICCGGVFGGFGAANIRSFVVFTDWAVFDTLSYVVATIVVPEPASLVLLGAGLLGLAMVGRKRQTAA